MKITEKDLLDSCIADRKCFIQRIRDISAQVRQLEKQQKAIKRELKMCEDTIEKLAVKHVKE